MAKFDNDTKALDVCHRDIFKHKKSKKNTLTIWESWRTKLTFLYQ